MRFTYSSALIWVHQWHKEIHYAGLEYNGPMVTTGDLIKGTVHILTNFQSCIISEENAVSITWTLIFLLYILSRLFAILLVSGEEVVVGTSIFSISPIFSVPGIVDAPSVHLS